MAGRHSGTAVRDRPLRSAELLVPGTKLFGRFEATVRAKVFLPRRMQSARDVARFGVDRLEFAAIPLRSSRVEQRHAAELTHRFEIEDTRPVGLARGEVT